MNVARRTRVRQTGASLLEVAIALGIAALALLGAVSSQIVAMRTERNSAQRELASLIAASAADALRDRSASTSELEYWRAQARQALPRGDVTVHETGGGAAFVAVRWARSQVSVDARTTGFDGCPREFAVPEVSCSAAPFVRKVEP